MAPRVAQQVLAAGAPAIRAAAARDVEGLRHQATGLAEATPPRLRLGYAHAFVAAVVGAYWEHRRPRSRHALRRAPASLGRVALRREGLALAQDLGEAAAALDTEGASYLIGRTYAAMLPTDVRSANGVYYTPPAVVGRLLDAAEQAGIDWTSCRALDPACGGGAFLGPLARRMAVSLRGADRRVAERNLAARLVGYELDPFAAWLSAVFLDATLLEVLGWSPTEAFDPIQIGNSLQRLGEPAQFDLVAGNPPYGRVKLPAALRAAFKRGLYGHANLYGLFLELAVQKTRPGGVIAYVTPTGFLCGEYFKNLRRLLLEEARPQVFDFIAERDGVFDDVLQETLLVTFKRSAARESAPVHFAAAEGPGGLKTVDGGAITLPRDGDGPWILPRSAEASPLVDRLRGMPSRLADWGYGVSTGPLVWNRYKDQLRERPGAGHLPLIWAESVGPDGTFEFRAARRNHAPYFAVRAGDDFLTVRQACVLLQRTTAKEQARRLLAAELPQAFLDEHGGQVTVENHLNMVVPLVAAPAVTPRALAAFLNSAAADRVFRCISGTVAVSAYELEAMPLPAAWSLTPLDELLDAGATPETIETYCSRLYGAP